MRKALVSSVLVAAGFLGLLPTPTSAENSYNNPVDGKTYSAEGGWRTYQPESPLLKKLEKVSLGNVRLLQGEETVGSRTTPNALAAFVQSAVKAGAAVFADQPSPAQILVQFSCLPGKHTVQLAYDGSISSAQLQHFYDALVALTPLQVSDEVLFQFTVVVAP